MAWVAGGLGLALKCVLYRWQDERRERWCIYVIHVYGRGFVQKGRQLFFSSLFFHVFNWTEIGNPKSSPKISLIWKWNPQILFRNQNLFLNPSLPLSNPLSPQKFILFSDLDSFMSRSLFVHGYSSWLCESDPILI